MKLLLPILLLFLSGATFGQTFYVEPTEKGYEKEVSNKLSYEGYKLVKSGNEADFRIECLVIQTSKFNSMFKGYARILDKSGTEVARTKEVKRGAVAINGFNAGANIFQVISEKYLIPEITKLSKSKTN